MIIGEVRRFLRDNNSIRVSRSMRDLAYKALQAREELTNEQLTEPSIDAICMHINEKKEDVVLALEAITEPISLYEPVYNDSGDSLYVLDQIKDSSSDDEIWIEDIALKEAIKKLDEREKRIIDMRFYMGKTQSEVAVAIGISQAQVSRLEKGALESLIFSPSRSANLTPSLSESLKLLSNAIIYSSKKNSRENIPRLYCNMF